MSVLGLPWSLQVAARLAPPGTSDPFVGDLLEEASIVGERDGPRFIARQVLRSLPHLLGSRLRWEVSMNGFRWFSALVILVLGLLQAWDSHILASSSLVKAITIAAVVVLASSVRLGRTASARLSIVAAGALLLVAARILSPVRLPELLLILLPAVFMGVALDRHQAPRTEPRGPATA